MRTSAIRFAEIASAAACSGTATGHSRRDHRHPQPTRAATVRISPSEAVAAALVACSRETPSRRMLPSSGAATRATSRPATMSASAPAKVRSTRERFAPGACAATAIAVRYSEPSVPAWNSVTRRSGDHAAEASAYATNAAPGSSQGHSARSRPRGAARISHAAVSPAPARTRSFVNATQSTALLVLNSASSVKVKVIVSPAQNSSAVVGRGIGQATAPAAAPVPAPPGNPAAENGAAGRGGAAAAGMGGARNAGGETGAGRGGPQRRTPPFPGEPQSPRRTHPTRRPGAFGADPAKSPAAAAPAPRPAPGFL